MLLSLVVPVFLAVAAQATVASPDAEPMTARRDDAAMDQAWLSPTALTQPANAVTLEGHELTVLRATVAPSDRFQVTLGALLPILGSAWLGSATAKLRVADVARFHLSVLAGGGVASEITFREARERFLSAGMAASFCGDVSCRGVLSAYALVNPTQGANHTFARFLYGASLVVPVVPHLKLVTEANLTAELHGDGAPQPSGHKELAVVAGVRLYWPHVAATLGLLGLYRWPPDGASGDSREARALFPAFSLGGRFGGS